MRPRFRSPCGPRIVFVAALVIMTGPIASQHTASANPAPLSAHGIRAALIAQETQLKAPAPALTTAQLAPEDMVAGEAAVTFSPNVSLEAATQRIQSLGGTLISSVPRMNVYEVQLPDRMSVDGGIAALAALPGAERAEPLVEIHSSLHPNDPLYSDFQTNYLAQIHAEQAWDMQLGDPGVIVAVLDSGFELLHPDLRNQFWTNPNPGHAGCGNDVHGCNFVDPRRIDASCDNQDATPAPNPDVSPFLKSGAFYHGTFVSGVIAASINNGIGVAGVAPHVSIMPVRVGDCKKPFDTAIANGVMYAADNGAAVINISFGSCRQWPSFMIDAITYAQQRGVLIVAAAGNENQRCVDSPANLPGVVGVSATDTDGQTRASFSSWGPEVSVAAPGVGIVSTIPFRNARPPNDYYTRDSGTSFSTPLVSGLAALLLSENPFLTPEMLRTLIRRGATPLPEGNTPNWAGAGRIDFAASLRLAPSTFYGRASIDGRDVPDGAPVEARIAGQICGQASTFTRNGSSQYALFVSTAADRPGCGTAGAAVAISVNGAPAGSAVFKAGAVALDLPVGGQGSASDGTLALFHAGWNLVSLPAGQNLPGAGGRAYTLQPGDNSYEVIPVGTPSQAGRGYWVYFPADQSLSLAADSLAADSTGGATVILAAGAYAMIGNPSGTRTVTVSGADAVYTYDPASGTYHQTTMLKPGEGAWVVSASGAAVTIH